MNAVDTNVLIYAHDPRDVRKNDIANALVAGLDDGVLMWQVACEYVSAIRKLPAYVYDQKKALQDLGTLSRAWTLIRPNWSVLENAERLGSRFSLSWWDALLISACLEGGVERLYSEDFDAYTRIDGLELVNPFR